MEGTEDFFATLSIPASSVYLGVSAVSVDSVTVSILDDDHVTVEFSMSEYEVSESAVRVALYISVSNMYLAFVFSGALLVLITNTYISLIRCVFRIAICQGYSWQ